MRPYAIECWRKPVPVIGTDFFLILGGAPRFYTNFTDKPGFLEHLSVKSRSKRLNFYGQTAVFDHFVRNRHFWSRLITDKVPILIDLSVNGSDFAKCSAALQLLNHCTWLRLRAKHWFLRFARNLSPHCFGEGNQVEHFLNFSGFCSTFGAARTEFGVDGRTFSQFFEILFYFRGRAGRIWRRR